MPQPNVPNPAVYWKYCLTCGAGADLLVGGVLLAAPSVSDHGVHHTGHSLQHNMTFQHLEEPWTAHRKLGISAKTFKNFLRNFVLQNIFSKIIQKLATDLSFLAKKLEFNRNYGTGNPMKTLGFRKVFEM